MKALKALNIQRFILPLVAGVGVYFSGHRLQALPDTDSAPEFRLPAHLLRIASFGYDAALSDIYWMQAVQYYGSHQHEVELYPGLSSLLTTAVDLDPEFDFIYQFGGEVLPMIGPDGAWHHTQAAIDLLEKGMESHSQRWQLPWLLAYNLYTFRGDYLRAGELVRVAAQRPKSPAYLSGFAAKLLAQGGSVATAIEFAESALQRTTDERTQRDLEDRLRALHLQAALEALNRAAQARLANGQPLTNLSDLVGFAGLQSLPEEPYGGTFSISGSRVVSSDDDKLLHVFIHPGRAPAERYVD